MKKILISLGTILLLGGAAAAVSYTGAFFNDTETSANNTFTTGSIDLKVDSTSHYDGLVCQYNSNDKKYEWVAEGDTQRSDLIGTDCNGSWVLTDLGPTNQFFNFADLKPGDSGENTLSLHVINNDALACAVINNMHDDDLSLTSPEYKAGDPSSGPDRGEVASQLHFFAWNDNGGTPNSGGVAGDNIWNGDEQQLFSNTEGPASDVLNGVAYQLGQLPAGDTSYIGIYWCYGDITVGVHTLSCDGSSVNNLSQTDRLTADISFYVEQQRNNDNFQCLTPTNDDPRIIKVSQNDLDPNGASAVSPAVVLFDGLGKWFFYNDTTDEVDNTLGTIAAGPGTPIMGPGSAQMTLDPTHTRKALTTYQFAGTPLSDITELKYGVYPDGTTGAASLQFNIDLDGSDTWQHRLLYEPDENGDNPAANTWTSLDALAGTWTWSGLTGHGGSSATWPDGSNTEFRTWNDIKTAFPNARIRVSDPWLGFRIGSPGPSGLTNSIDFFTIQTTGNPATTFNFTN